MSDLRRGLVKDQLSAARRASARVEGRPSLKALDKEDRNRCLYAMDLIEQSFDRLIAIDEPQGLAWIALRCEFLSTTEDNLRKRRGPFLSPLSPSSPLLAAHLLKRQTKPPTSPSAPISSLSASKYSVNLVKWQRKWEDLGLDAKREDEVLTLIAHASDSKLLVERLLKHKKRQLKHCELADPAYFSHSDSEDGEEERRREWESEVEAAKKEVEAVEAVLDYVTASLILPKGEICETRYLSAPPPPPPPAPARRATHPHPVRAGHARRPTLVQASIEDGKKLGGGEGEGWWGLLNFFKRRNTEPALSTAGEDAERELEKGGRRERGMEGTYRMRRRYLGEGY